MAYGDAGHYLRIVHNGETILLIGDDFKDVSFTGELSWIPAYMRVCYKIGRQEFAGEVDAVISEVSSRLERVNIIEEFVAAVAESIRAEVLLPSELIIGRDGDSVYINGIDATRFVKSAEEDTICLDVRYG